MGKWVNKIYGQMGKWVNNGKCKMSQINAKLSYLYNLASKLCDPKIGPNIKRLSIRKRRPIFHPLLLRESWHIL